MLSFPLTLPVVGLDILFTCFPIRHYVQPLISEMANNTKHILDMQERVFVFLAMIGSTFQKHLCKYISGWQCD